MHSNAPMNMIGFRLLTSRETQLVLLASEGLTDKEIAKTLGISLGTVITLWSKARAKLGINSRISAVAVMISAIVRVSSQFAVEDGEPASTSAVTHLTGIRMLVNNRQVALSCSPQAYRLLGVRPGTSMLEHLEAIVPLRDAEGNPLPKADWPWVESLENGRHLKEVPLVAGSGDAYSMNCHAVHDPILGNVVMIELKAESAPHKDEISCLEWHRNDRVVVKAS